MVAIGSVLTLLSSAPADTSAWVPGGDGNLHRPNSVLLISSTGKPNPFLLSKIPFKPPVIDQLAREAGIEPGVLELLKKLGVTSEAELRERLGLKTEPEDKTGEDPGDVKDALKELLGDAPQTTPPVPDPGGSEPAPGRTADAGGGDGAKSRTSVRDSRCRQGCRRPR